MNNNKHYKRFASILSTIEESGISTAEELKLVKKTALWNELYFATQNFVNYYALASKTSKNKKGEIISGNADKVKFLIEDGGLELYDIQMDILVHIIKKVNYILAQSPVPKKIFYTFRIVNNEVNNMLRSLPPVKVVPWDAPINSDTNEDGAVLSEVVGDNTYNPECLHVEHETIKELKKVLRAKQVKELAEKKAKEARELAEKRESILREIPRLATHATEVFARLGWHLGIKTRDLAARIIDNGYENTFAQLIIDIATKYNIDLEDIRNIITVSKLTEESYKKDKGLVRLLSRDPKVVADQISKYANRAKGHLDNYQTIRGGRYS